MNPLPDLQTWFGPSSLGPGVETVDKPQEFERLWCGFINARLALGLVLVLLQGTIYVLGASADPTLMLICAVYFAAALAVRLMASPRPLGKTFDSQWISIIGVDVLAFTALQVSQSSSINYAPLFALPVLMASVLGSLLLAMGVAAGVTLLLFFHAMWLSLQVPGDTVAHFLQAALTGAGCFVMAFVAHEIATRLANVELRAQRSQLAARVQSQVNELVIESMSDGILVLDPRGVVWAANPAARRLMGPERFVRDSTFDLASRSGWQGLVDLMKLSFSSNLPQQADIHLHHAGQGPRRVRVQTQLTATQYESADRLCVMFLQDQREIEAQMRTEKLASMGRMSAAVAHEIRNPLAAIAQANALLDEDMSEPRHKQLTQMVQQNARRLEKIVEEVLNISRLQQHDDTNASRMLILNEAVAKVCRDWQDQTGSQHLLAVNVPPDRIEVRFETEHLRRILVNLLDNASRFASQQPEAIQVTVGMGAGQGTLSVWSDGQPMEQSVERHLFEPFFSSESRSTGLGLYICRELCEGHGASIAYSRTQRSRSGTSVEGNEFLITLRTKSVPSSDATAITN
jgi:two-component system sensor histidine kinase PilS (NtrC family)